MAINWSRRSYTKEEFIEAWNTSLCVSDVVRKLIPDRKNFRVGGGNIQSAVYTASELGLTRDHFSLSQVFARSRFGPSVPALPLDAILIENSLYTNTHNLKRRLFRENLKLPECENPDCSVREDRKKNVPLCLDHINGKRGDNRIENLRILCYNCHGLTDTYAGRNRHINSVKTGQFLTYNSFTNSEKSKKLQSQHSEIKNEKQSVKKKINKINKAKTPYIQQEKIDYPSTQEIIKNIEIMGYRAYGKILGVSDNSIRKCLKRRDVIPLPGKLRKHTK